MIRLNLVKFQELQGKMTETAMAEHIGIARSQVWRVKQGKSAPGEEFISKVMAKYPQVPFEDIFITDN